MSVSRICLDDLCFSESLERTVFGDGSKSLSRNLDSDCLIKFSYVHSLLLKVW